MNESTLNDLIEHIQSLGFKSLTNIQKKAVPIILNKVNTLIISPTGTGKTEAAILPLFYLVAKEKDRQGLKILYITPLRALNRDLFRRIKSYADHFGLSVDIRHGDTPTSRRKMILDKPPDLLISTPETLSILITLPNFIKKLENVDWVIVDEVHELVNSKRGVHLAFSLERLEKIRPGFIRVGLSATVGSPNKAKQFLFGLGRKGAIVVDRISREYTFENVFVEGDLTDVAQVALDKASKQIQDGKSVILFTNTRQMAEYMATLIRAKDPEILIEVHHGSLSRESREQTEIKLREGTAKMVVTTSSLELGIDIGSVSLVIQINSPRQAIKLLQRVGRSEHKVGGKAMGLILNNTIDDYIETDAICQLIEKSELEEPLLHFHAFDVLAHHIVGLVIIYKAVKFEEILKMAKKMIFFADLDVQNIFDVVNILVEIKAVRLNNDTVYRGSRCFSYYFNNVSMIPENMQYTVISCVNNAKIGHVDQLFVREALDQQRPFILRGSAWNVLSIEDERQIVRVEPTNVPESEIPYWIGELIPVERKTATLVGKIRRQYKNENITYTNIKETLEKTEAQLGTIPDEKQIIIESKFSDGVFVLHSCFGTKVNNTLGTALSTLLTSKLGYTVGYSTDPYRIVLNGGELLTPDLVSDVLMHEIDLEEILEVAVRDSNLIRTRGWHVSKRFGIIPRRTAYDSRLSGLIMRRYSNTSVYREALNEIFIDKFDIGNTNRLLADIRSQEIPIIFKRQKEFSPLAELGLKYNLNMNRTTAYDINMTILNTIKERLESRRHKLLCLSCGKSNKIILTREVSDPIYCQKCRSRLVTMVSTWDDTANKIINKRLQNIKLTKEESDEYRRLWKISSLLQNFGKKAVFVLSGYGIGPSNAVKILDKKASEEELLREIYRAERVFIRTRPFWDSSTTQKL